MARPGAPSMPTRRQIDEVVEAVKALYPGARIKSVGPDGVAFDYPDGKSVLQEWADKPFSG
ncbi:hypothetical protein [Salipiger thiooxidans]|uniref:hypothetical protein n=1 Tax=Salipiger thiooxidans TaxID=282683 RepID=UPI001CD7441A|nr:hypothetical protein [Salipiger thiooxidans]MCA0850867.1 hypothetical protein [Salipiger thiooxidans]